MLFEDDTSGTVATLQPSYRYEIEWANYYSVTKWLTLNFNYANSLAHFTTPDEDGGTRVPEAIEQVIDRS
ncbi:MAG TPA: hypothetical protein VEC99_12565 [Clostridia bacterium]|nr:hypothetical protein [Clostridia bacterium]